MHHLGVPTTRALSLVTTGENILRDIMYDGNPAHEPGAIVCRIAPSFIRFGSFQIHSATSDIDTLRSLVEHTVRTHFPSHTLNDDVGRIAWLSQIAEDTALMISHWMRVGFVHGVMNTDNMSIHGLTIDYGCHRLPQRQRRLRQEGARQEGARQEDGRQEGARPLRRRQAPGQHRS
jgi:uncharacterized protein YdiU (UPF0061 family)